MKVKLAIICGILIWFFTNVLTTLIQPFFTENTTYLSLLLPAIIIIVVGFFGIIYIREINKNEIIEGLIAGIIFFIIDILLDLAFFVIPKNANILLYNYPTHIALMLILMLLITTFLGYLAQMNIELK